MNPAMLLALLLQSGACGDMPFTAANGTTLHIIVCPHMEQADEAPPEHKPINPKTDG